MNITDALMQLTVESLRKSKISCRNGGFHYIDVRHNKNIVLCIYFLNDIGKVVIRDIPKLETVFRLNYSSPTLIKEIIAYVRGELSKLGSELGPS